MDFEEIYPSIVVYKNAVSDIDSLLEKIKYSENKSNGKFILEEWSQWFVFGTYTNPLPGLAPDDAEEIYNKNSDNLLVALEKEIYDTISLATKTCVEHYIKLKKVKIPDNHRITSPNIAKYIRTEWLDDNRDSSWGSLVMHFHTDYEVGKWFLKCRQFLITANLYINDDYEGGEIIFYHNDSLIEYKPQKGDLIVFPSGSPLYPDHPNRNPYFHGVGLVFGGEKYFTRSYIEYETEYQDFYYELKNKFKDKEKFEEKIQEIVRGGYNIAGVFMGNGPPNDESIPFDVNKWEHGDDFCVHVDKIIDLLYDIKYGQVFFSENREDWWVDLV